MCLRVFDSADYTTGEPPALITDQRDKQNGQTDHRGNNRLSTEKGRGGALLSPFCKIGCGLLLEFV